MKEPTIVKEVIGPSFGLTRTTRYESSLVIREFENHGYKFKDTALITDGDLASILLPAQHSSKPVIGEIFGDNRLRS